MLCTILSKAPFPFPLNRKLLSSPKKSSFLWGFLVLVFLLVFVVVVFYCCWGFGGRFLRVGGRRSFPFEAVPSLELDISMVATLMQTSRHTVLT